MIIEKTVVENNRFNINQDDYVAENELTVTITLNEYRNLISESIENKQRKEHESWLEQYTRANSAEKRVKELEEEVGNLYKQIARMNQGESEGEQET